METTATFRGLACTVCGTTTAADAARCPDCGGTLAGDYDAPALAPEDLADRAAQAAAVLPFETDTLVSLDEGGTPLVTVPPLAAELGVEAVYVKDEGRNTTGSLADRKLSVAVTGAVQSGADAVAAPSTGNGAQAAAAYAARADIDSKGYVPSRCPFLNKAMVNVHGGDMRVVEGRYDDAVEAFKEGAGDRYSVEPGHPFRVEGAKPVAVETVADLDWTAPDAVIHPTGHGESLVGLERGFAAAAASGLVDREPELYAVQPDGCAPVADAWIGDSETPAPVEHPDTIVGPLEVPDPAAGTAALAAVESSGGGAAAVDDKAVLQGAVDGCELGPEVGATGGTAVAGARELADSGAFASDDVVVLVNPVAGSKEADLLRSHLMSQGI
ncbi:pyridoxal-phosphate dependent enzyme [Haloarcula sp. GH36]|uniref:pyridoxal-phosphate dependent enzyme n=1 Tax=Haloarcula montana TaxID=3111776 RepID=UPI002D78EA37|nr:pyridoxal-phosphate dependent enzyme [Haloarcula sp. GH36]